MNDKEELFDDEDDAEGGSDYKIRAEDFSDIFVIPSDWTVSTLRHELVDVVDLSPSFQRRSVWTPKAKSKFIESLVLGIPIPQILLAERPDERNKLLVLDGKQRLSSLKEFFEGRLDDGKPFKLQGLDDLEYLNGESWDTIKKNYPRIARSIDGASIRTAIIRGWTREDVLYEIFHRLNSGSVKLSPMELRMSLIRGPFVRDVVDKTSTCRNLQKMLGLSLPDKRMRDVEVAIRHMAYHGFNTVYRGNLKEFLDDYCRSMNRGYDESALDAELLDLEQLISAGIEIFDAKYFGRKFNSEMNVFEGSFNRAVFDVLGGSLRNKDLREAAIVDVEKFVSLFKEACRNGSFVKSVETTTKSVAATNYRFSIWYGMVERAYKIKLRMPLVAPND